MINSTNTVNIDGAAIREIDLKNLLDTDSDDTFTRWVVRPLALLAAIGLGVAVFFASAVLIMVSLALLPLLAVAMWAMKSKLKRELESAGQLPETDDDVSVDVHGQTAS
ncbi:MAG: hypothetical protein AAF404_17440 [Pseudomonadota bacterium]